MKVNLDYSKIKALKDALWTYSCKLQEFVNTSDQRSEMVADCKKQIDDCCGIYNAIVKLCNVVGAEKKMPIADQVLVLATE